METSQEEKSPSFSVQTFWLDQISEVWCGRLWGDGQVFRACDTATGRIWMSQTAREGGQGWRRIKFCSGTKLGHSLTRAFE